MGEMDRPPLVTWYTLLVVLSCLTATCCASCTYPSDLTGVWFTSHESDAELLWTESNVTSFTYTTTGTSFANLVYECFLNDGNFYVSKTTTEITIFGASFYVYTCWVFTKMSSNKYLYRQAVTQETQVDGARVKVFTSATVITQASEICDDVTYEKNQFSILLRNGTAESEKTSCPSPLLATGQYTITDSSGTNYCNLNSWLDGCTDSGTLTANYTVCSDKEIFFSETGVVYCMYSTSLASDSGTYYVSLFNADTSPDQSSFYYFTCAVADTRSDGVYITYFPGDCLNETYQNATYISESTGFNVVLNSNTTCVPSSSEDNLALILGIVFGLLFFIAIVIVLVYLCYTKVYLVKKQRTSRSGSKVVPDTLPNTAMSQGGKNYRMMFTPAPPRSAAPGGRHRDYNDGGQGSQTSMRPPVSQLAYYRTPTPRITDSKVEGSDIQTQDVVQSEAAKLVTDGKFESEPKSLEPKEQHGTEAEHDTVTVPMYLINYSAPNERITLEDGETEEVSQDTSTDVEAKNFIRTPSVISNNRKTREAQRFIAPVAHSFDKFYQKKGIPPSGRSTPKERPQSSGRSAPKRPQSSGRPTPKEPIVSSGSAPKRPQSRQRDNGKPPSANSNKNKSKRIEVASKDGGGNKDMDLDSVLDFDTKRLGEPDGAESGVVMDMEGSLPVFSDSGDLTPEPTRVTPHGQINRAKKPKATPRGVALQK